jgi:hypothetical protein
VLSVVSNLGCFHVFCLPTGKSSPNGTWTAHATLRADRKDSKLLLAGGRELISADHRAGGSILDT